METAKRIDSDPERYIRRQYRRRFGLPLDHPLLSRPVGILLVELCEERVLDDEDGDLGDGEVEAAPLDWDTPILTGDPVVDEWELAIARGDDADLE